VRTYHGPWTIRDPRGDPATALARVGRARLADPGWTPPLAATPTARPEAPRWGEGPEEWILLGDGGDPALADVLRAALEAAAGRAVLRWLHARRPWRAQADHRGLALEVRLRAAPDPGSALRVVEAGGVGAVAAGALAR
jgi:hypothetical protein